MFNSALYNRKKQNGGGKAIRDVKKGENSGGVTAPLLSKVEACLVISLAAILILFMAIDAL